MFRITAQTEKGNPVFKGRISSDFNRAGVSPAEACHIGDEPATDIEGARNVGIAPILIDRKGHNNGDAFTKVKSFHDLK